MARPRLLLVAGISELEWQIRPQLEEWAETAAFDPPGIGASPGEWSIEASVARALAEVKGRGWEDYVLVADGWGCWYVPGILAAGSDRVRGFALGHAALSTRMTGERPPWNAAVWEVLASTLKQGREAFARFAIPQFTRDGINEAVAGEMVERIPIPVFEAFMRTGQNIEHDLEAALRPLDIPLLLVQHRDCLLFSDEGYADAVAAFPRAKTAATEKTCSADPAFADALKRFCEGLSR
jgi:pimeloyl-ACP methyl ester carboxylesterase